MDGSLGLEWGLSAFSTDPRHVQQRVPLLELADPSAVPPLSEWRVLPEAGLSPMLPPTHRLFSTVAESSGRWVENIGGACCRWGSWSACELSGTL